MIKLLRVCWMSKEETVVFYVGLTAPMWTKNTLL